MITLVHTERASLQPSSRYSGQPCLNRYSGLRCLNRYSGQRCLNSDVLPHKEHIGNIDRNSQKSESRQLYLQLYLQPSRRNGTTFLRWWSRELFFRCRDVVCSVWTWMVHLPIIIYPSLFLPIKQFFKKYLFYFCWMWTMISYRVLLLSVLNRNQWRMPHKAYSINSSRINKSVHITQENLFLHGVENFNRHFLSLFSFDQCMSNTHKHLTFVLQ